MSEDRLNAFLTRLLITLASMLASFVTVRTLGSGASLVIVLIFGYVVMVGIRMRRTGKITKGDYLLAMTSGVFLGLALAR